MGYLADTDVLIDHIRGKNYLDVQVINEGLGMSILSLAELLYGAYKSVNPQKNLGKVDELLKLGIKVENLNPQIIDSYAQLKADLARSGQKLDEFDLLIAATAKVLSLTLITRNLKHFQRIEGLKIA